MKVVVYTTKGLIDYLNKWKLRNKICLKRKKN